MSGRPRAWSGPPTLVCRAVSQLGQGRDAQGVKGFPMLGGDRPALAPGSHGVDGDTQGRCEKRSLTVVYNVAVGTHDASIVHDALLSRKCLLHHARPYVAIMTTPHDRLKAVRVKRFDTAKEAAEAMGVPVATYIQHENGTRGFPTQRAKQYADFFRSTPEWLLYGRTPPAKIRRMVRLVGYVGAGGGASFYESAELGEVEAPEDATAETVAVQVRGTSLGPLFDNWLIFYDDVRRPVTDDLHGELCVVGLADGRVLVKRLRPARAVGLYHLDSNMEPTLNDVEVVWAAKVSGMRPA